MVTLRSILCAVDFSEPSQQALRWAIAVAALQRSRLTVFTAVDPLLAAAARARLHQDLVHAETQPALREFVAGVSLRSASTPLDVTVDARVGDAPDAILEAAERHHVDLIVLGTRGLSGMRKLLLGSTTERVLRGARTPILAIPAEAAAVDVTTVASSVKKVMAATDFSDTSIRAMRWAADLAQQLAVPLVLLHVVRPVLVATHWQPYVDLAGETRTTEARRRLEKLSADLPRGAEAEVVVTVGRPADEISATAQAQNAGLIVMGLMGEGALGSPRPGSIAYQVLGAAPVPVLVVPPAGA